ncbi:MAG TPA: UrcA family protein [Gammaproteobacteria bacterium]|nr:UrcA family protein [Gammaproteobacteria bacterium]
MQRTQFLAPVVGTLLALGTSFGGAVAAEPAAADARSVTIEYGDLELGNGLAVDKLHARIAAAAERACGDYDARNLRARAAWLACYDVAVADALDRAQLPALAERNLSGRKRPVG